MSHMLPKLQVTKVDVQLKIWHPDSQLRFKIKYMDSFCGAAHLHDFMLTYPSEISDEQFMYTIWAAGMHCAYFQGNRRIFLTCNELQWGSCQFLAKLKPYLETDTVIKNKNSGLDCHLCTFILPELIEEYEDVRS